MHPLMESPKTLYEPIKYILTLGGKRMRPLMVLLANHLFADNTDEALYPALSLEVFSQLSP